MSGMSGETKLGRVSLRRRWWVFIYIYKGLVCDFGMPLI